jgi:hypothetical protein
MCAALAARSTKPATRSRCARLISGPICISAPDGSPNLMVEAAEARSATSRSWIVRPA